MLGPVCRVFSDLHEKRHWMSEFYVVAGIIVVLGLAVMFIISKVQE
jgi:hypothetical protein